MRKIFWKKFYRTYQEYDLPENSIEFELTESMFFDQEHIERIKKEILKMHEMGFRCSMDDFGFGYSSLGLLKEFDVDTLKMDRSFFLDMSSEKAQGYHSERGRNGGKAEGGDGCRGNRTERADELSVFHPVRYGTGILFLPAFTPPGI